MSVEELFGLSGRVALVLGASSGLGAECARAFAEAGADVALLARREDRLEVLAGELSGRGVKVHTCGVDARDDEALGRAVEQVERELGPPWVMLNAAGVSRLGQVLRHTRQKWDEVLAVNLTAAFVSSQCVARRMVEHGQGGRIIHISSVLGRGASPIHAQVGYAASKGGVDNLTRQLAVELSPHHITVNAIAPGYFPTELTAGPAQDALDPDFANAVAQRTPLGRPGRLAEIRSTALYLAAPASSYVTGAIVPVDGGWTAW